MKILIFIILISSTFSLNSKLEPSLYNISAITTALSDVINKYIAEENLLLNISIFGNQTALENDIIDKTLSKVKYKLRIEHIKENENKKRGVQNSLFILGQESFLENINKKLTFIHQAPQKHKIFIYIKNLKVFEVVDFLFEINRERQIDHFLYFVHDFGNKIDLVTYEWFTETRCNNKTKIIINTFDKLKLKWKKPLEKYEKFRNLHDCKIVAMQFSSSYKDSFNKTKGHAFEVLEAIGSKVKFSVYRQHGKLNNFNIVYKENDKLKVFPQIFVELVAYTGNKLFGTSVIDNLKYSVILSNGELYSSYEKLLLPFDAITWCLLILTFGIAFITIFIVNHMSRQFQILLYGASIHFPAFNVVGTFFGISQSRVPISNFPRMVLMFFILFCLVIRTAYQGVFFEMMATKMHKPVAETVNDLIEQNYTIYARHNRIGIDIIQRFIKKKFNYFKEFSEVCNIMTESSIKKAIILSNTGIETFYKVCKMQPVLLKENLLTLPVAMVTFPNHFLFDVINEHTIWLVQAGIPQYWFQYQNWYSFFRHHKIESDELESINLDSLSFGFIIWLATCGISLIVFAIEIGMWQKIINLWTQKWQAEDDNKNKIKKSKVKTKLIHVKPAGNDENFLNKVRKP